MCVVNSDLGGLRSPKTCPGVRYRRFMFFYQSAVARVSFLVCMQLPVQRIVGDPKS